MPSLTRRRALLAAASSIVPLAGCAGEDERPSLDYRENERTIEDYDARRTRNDDGAVLFTQSETLPTASDDGQGRYARSSRSVVISEAELTDITFGEVPEADRLRAFATATDFDASSLYLLAMPVEACSEIRLRSVSVDSYELESGDLHPHAGFCETYRPADVDCDGDGVHTAGFAIRLPVAAERSSGSGTGMGHSCEQPRRGESFETTVTPVGGGEDE